MARKQIVYMNSKFSGTLIERISTCRCERLRPRSLWQQIRIFVTLILLLVLICTRWMHGFSPAAPFIERELPLNTMSIETAISDLFRVDGQTALQTTTKGQGRARNRHNAGHGVVLLYHRSTTIDVICDPFASTLGVEVNYDSFATRHFQCENAPLDTDFFSVVSHADDLFS